MPVTRRFLIAPSLTRLIRKECGSERVTEGHFPPQAERQSHVRLEKALSFLVLQDGPADSPENRTELPRAHAEALLDACPGSVTFERSVLRLQDRQALVDRLVTPGPLDRVSVEFPTPDEAAAFHPPVWFGSEVSEDDGYTNRAVALSGLPQAPERPLSNEALDALLDAIEGQPGRGPAVARTGAPKGNGAAQGNGTAEEDSTFEMLRRLAVVTPTKETGPAADAPTDQAREAKPHRPKLQAAGGRAPEGDERMAGVIEGLSEALTQPTPEPDSPEGELKARPAWRWSSH